MGYKRSRLSPLRSILKLLIVVGLVGYIWKHIMERIASTEDCNGRIEQDELEPQDRAMLEQQLREEARRYEADLRELARS
jgi:hypothetical protein